MKLQGDYIRFSNCWKKVTNYKDQNHSSC